MHQAGLPLLTEPIGVAIDIDRGRLVQQPIENGARVDRVSEHLAPRAQTLIAGEQDGAAFVAPTDQLEEEIRALPSVVMSAAAVVNITRSPSRQASSPSATLKRVLPTPDGPSKSARAPCATKRIVAHSLMTLGFQGELLVGRSGQGDVGQAHRTPAAHDDVASRPCGEARLP